MRNKMKNKRVRLFSLDQLEGKSQQFLKQANRSQELLRRKVRRVQLKQITKRMNKKVKSPLNKARVNDSTGLLMLEPIKPLNQNSLSPSSLKERKNQTQRLWIALILKDFFVYIQCCRWLQKQWKSRYSMPSMQKYFSPKSSKFHSKLWIK